MCRDHGRLTECKYQNRQNEPPGQVDVTTRVEVSVMADPRHDGASRTDVVTTDV